MNKPPLTAAHETPGPARPLGRRARRRADTRLRILRAAWALFERQGFFATTVEHITEQADVGKGTFFNYFPSKEHVLAGFGEMQLNKVRTILGQARQQRQPAGSVFHHLIHALAEEPGRSPALVRNLMVANLMSEPVRRLMWRNLKRARRLLAEFIAEGQRSGQIRTDRSPVELAQQFQQTYFGVLMLWAIHPTPKLRERLEATFRLFWPGIVGRSKGA